MKRILFTLLSLFIWICFAISCIILGPLFVLLWLLTVIPDKKLWLLHRLASFWGAIYIWCIPFWSLKIYGRQKLKDKEIKIMVSNHQSFVDILIVNSLFRHYKWTSKDENFKLPFVGWVLTLGRCIRIYRGADDAWQKFYKQASKTLAEGNTIMVFPEGTRSKTGNMGRFKEGAFLLALQTKTDIQPMVLDGSFKAFPKTGWVLTRHQKMVLKVLDPVPYESFKDLTANQTAKKVHAIIQRALIELREKPI